MTMIETKDLTFAYPAEEGKRSEPALRGVSLGIEKGSFVVVPVSYTHLTLPTICSV